MLLQHQQDTQEVRSDFNQVIEVFTVYNQATTKLAFHSNETSKDKMRVI